MSLAFYEVAPLHKVGSRRAVLYILEDNCEIYIQGFTDNLLL
ncbi:hypothetical protein Leryth_016270 [Lithospermum erythrorhizon]|nr:hypothetical protein Leryth_016270 [Lithospermum erythrorhizon]